MPELQVVEMKIDETEIAKRMQFVDFTNEDRKRISGIKSIVLGHVNEFTDGFFDHLAKFTESKVLLGSTHLGEVKRLKKEHLVAMVTGEYDQSYVKQRLHLGKIYSDVGLAATVFLGAFHLLMRSIGSQIMSDFKGTPQEAFLSFLSINKIAFFDLGLIQDKIVFERERVIRLQQDAIQDLSTPVLQLRDRLLILPIIGMIDTYRARLLTENLLRTIRDNRAKVVVIDITGVASIDSKVANHLVQTVSASRLMGAHVIVTGLAAEIAQTLVTLGVDLSSINTVGDLQGGIEEADRILGYKMTQIRLSTSAEQ